MSGVGELQTGVARFEQDVTAAHQQLAFWCEVQRVTQRRDDLRGIVLIAGAHVQSTLRHRHLQSAMKCVTGDVRNEQPGAFVR